MTRVGILDPTFLLTEHEDNVIVPIVPMTRLSVGKFTISWFNLEYVYKLSLIDCIKKKILAPSDPVHRYKYILKGINGSIHRGQLVAIVGPSGSGKSTFLETLIGRRKHSAGSILCESKNKLRISFIPQSNHFFEQLTVKETLTMASQLFQSTTAKVSQGNPGGQMNQMIESLSLGSCLNNPIIKCSGGQLKRLAVACELMKQTDLIVMDEPTSGLDSASTLSLVQMLADLVKERNVSMVLTIHQPSFRVFSTFDTIYALSCEGKCLYEGSPKSMVPFLAENGFECPLRYNPADFVIDIASGNYGMDRLQTLYQASIPRMADGQSAPAWRPSMDSIPEEISNLNPGRPLSAMIQYDNHPFLPHFLVLMKRSALVTLKNPWLFGLRLASHIIFTALIGAQMSPRIVVSGGCPYFPRGSGSITDGPDLGSGNQDEAPREFDPSDLEAIQEHNKLQEDAITDFMGIIFLMLIMLQFGAILPTILTMPLEVSTVMKERKNDWYSVSCYYWAKVVADIPFQLLFPIVANGILFLFAWFGQELANGHKLVLNPTDGIKIVTAVESEKAFNPAADNDIVFRYLMMTLVSIVFVLTAQAHGVLIGTIFIQSATVSAYIGTMSMIPFSLLSGFLIRIKDLMPIFQVVSFGAYFRYAFEMTLMVFFGWSRCSGGHSNLIADIGQGLGGQNLTASQAIEKEYLESRLLMYDWLHEKFDAGPDGQTGVSDFWINKLTELIVGDIVTKDGNFAPAILQYFGVKIDTFTLFLLILSFQALLIRVVTYALLRMRIKVD